MPKVDIQDKIYSDIKQYCELNGLKIKDYVNELLKSSFAVSKYGEKPPFMIRKEKIEKSEPVMDTVNVTKPETMSEETIQEVPKDKVEETVQESDIKLPKSRKRKLS